MKPESEPLENPPEAVRGLKHVLAAARYSLGGFVYLMREPAFVLELVGGVFLFILFWIIGANAGQFLGLALLCLAVFGVEALNTAIESIVDEISPHRSEFARRTKDIGSFAVFCILSATGLYSAWVLFSICSRSHCVGSVFPIWIQSDDLRHVTTFNLGQLW